MPVNPNPVYADLNDEELAAEQPLTESKMIRLRDNPRSVARNGATVTTAELQLCEGMRTGLADGRGYVASGGKVVDGGPFGAANAADSTYNSTGGIVNLPIDTVGTYLIWVHLRKNTGGSNFYHYEAKCHIVDNVIVTQSGIWSGVSLSNAAYENNRFSIIGGPNRIQFDPAGSGGDDATMYLLKVK